MKKIFVLGSINMDLVITSSYLPKAGETIIGKDFFSNPGGKGANQAVACAKLGGLVYMGGCVGDDYFSYDMLENLKRHGVNIDNIRTIQNQNSGIACITIIEKENRIIVAQGANALITKEDVDNLLNGANPGDIFLCQLENPISIIGYGLLKSKEKGLYTILNPAPANLEILSFLKFVDLIILNETEIKLMTKMNNYQKAASLLEVKDVIITLGSKGYFYYSKDFHFHGAPIKVDVVDTTAAGDTFCGGLALKIAKGKSIIDALQFANLCAAITVTKKGAQQAIPTLNEVLNYQKKNCTIK